VAVRGAGNLNSGFPLLASVSLGSTPLAQISTGDREHARTVRITISAAVPPATPTITVEIDPTGTGTGFVPVLADFSLADNGPVPATFKMGLSASTGDDNSYHEIRFKGVKTGTTNSIPTLGQSTLGALAAMLALFALRRHRRVGRLRV
jgi:hypothetical protein